MDRAKRAVAAGATALAAFVLVGGPTAAEAMARPGDSGSPSGHDRGGQRGDRGGNDRPRNQGPRNDSGRAATVRAPQVGGQASSGSKVRAPAPVFVAPTVTFGNGRQPAPARAPATVSVPQPDVAPPVVVPVPAPLGIPQAVVAPAAPVALSARHDWDAVRPGQPMTSWFGLAGLVLIPLGGAALGYRQARAAKAASGLVLR